MESKAKRKPAGAGRTLLALFLVLFLQAAWFIACASQTVPRRAAAWLDALFSPAPWLAERLLDLLVLLPLFAAVLLPLLLLRRRRGAGKRLALLLPLLAALALAAGYLPRRRFLLYRFAPVRENVLYRSGQVGLATLEGLIDEYGLKTVIFLRRPGPEQEGEEALARARGIEFRHLDMKDLAQATAGFLAVLDDPARRPALVHCKEGVDRTGLIVGIYRVEYEGWSNERAAAERSEFTGSDWREHSQKERFLLDYVPRSRRPGGIDAPEAGEN